MRILMVFDFNCDLAQEYGIYKNNQAFEIAKYVSSVNVSAGFHAGDPLSIKKALEFAKGHNLAVGAHIGYPDISGFGYRNMEMNNEEIEAAVIYQLGAISSFASALGVEIEHVRCHGAMYDKLNNDFEFAKTVACAVKKFNPWLNLVVGNPQTKSEIEKEVEINCSYEVLFDDTMSVRQLREMEVVPDTVHFRDLENAKRAYDVLKPSPVNYNRVKEQI